MYDIRPLTIVDVAHVCAIHNNAFQSSALTHLGIGAVQHYYEWLFDSSHFLAYRLGAVNTSGKMLGFCFGGRFNGAMSGFLRSHRGFLVRQVLTHPWLLLTNELLRERALRAIAILSTYHNDTPSPDINWSRHFGILALAVDPDSQGFGVGRRLMEESETEARRRGCSTMGLTVAIANTAAIAFYERLGWSVYTQDEAKSLAMVKMLV